MAKTLIKKIGPHAALYRDRKSGIAWVEDGTSGTGHSAHPNIDASGSVAGMKRKGWWGKNDRTVRAHGFIYNIDILHTSDDYDVIAARACQCDGNHGIHEGKAPGGKKRHGGSGINVVVVSDGKQRKGFSFPSKAAADGFARDMRRGGLDAIVGTNTAKLHTEVRSLLKK